MKYTLQTYIKINPRRLLGIEIPKSTKNYLFFEYLFNMLIISEIFNFNAVLYNCVHFPPGFTLKSLYIYPVPKFANIEGDGSAKQASIPHEQAGSG